MDLKFKYIYSSQMLVYGCRWLSLLQGWLTSTPKAPWQWRPGTSAAAELTATKDPGCPQDVILGKVTLEWKGDSKHDHLWPTDSGDTAYLPCMFSRTLGDTPATRLLQNKQKFLILSPQLDTLSEDVFSYNSETSTCVHQKIKRSYQRRYN